MNTVVLPWPPKELSPNARLHHMALHRAKKAYRTACWLQARKAGMSAATLLGAEEADVHLVFYPPDKRNRDADNMRASVNALDDLAKRPTITDMDRGALMSGMQAAARIIEVTPIEAVIEAALMYDEHSRAWGKT